MAQQDDFDYLLASGDIHAYVRYFLTLYPSDHHLPDLGLRVDQWLQLYDLIDHELFMEEITINGGEKGSDAIKARTSSHANWNTSTTVDRTLSKPASVVDLHSNNQTPIFMGESINSYPVKVPHTVSLAMHYKLFRHRTIWGWSSGIVSVPSLARGGFKTACNDFLFSRLL